MGRNISEAVAWTVVGPDGETSIGGWLGMHTYEASLKWATLREGHRYEFAYRQGEAVPVACLPGYVRSAISGLAHIAMKDAPQVAKLHVGVIDNWLNSTHPQPAELSEVSGDSVEASVPKGWRVTPHTEPWRSGDRWEVYGPNGGGGVNEHDIQCRSVRGLLDALAATGKQQVGEVQGSREQFEAAYRNMDLTRNGQGYAASDTNYTWNVWQAALASRQPVGAQGIDLEQLVRLRNDLHAMSKHGVKDGWQDAAIELVADVNKMIDGRDAGTGAG